MSVQTDLEARTAKLRAILEESNEALEEKGGMAADSLEELPGAIRDLDDGVELDVLEVEPTGQRIVVDAEDGHAYHRVIVAAVGGGSEYPAMEVPEEYLAYVEHARANLFTGDFADLVVWDSTRDGYDWIAVSFLMDDFSIESFDPNTTEVKATGWVTCGFTVSTGAWSVNDYRNTVSPGGNYARYIEFASCEIEYNGKKLFPVGVNRNVITVASANALPATAEEGTIAIVGV